MSIYFLEANDLIKIGYSEQVKRRAMTVLGTQRFGGKFLGFMPGDRELERHLHARFGELRDYGEWFRKSESLMAFISAVADPVYPDDKRSEDGEQLRVQEDVFCELAAENINAYIIASKKTRAEGLTKLSVWSGIGQARLVDILDGNTSTVTAGELAICTALGEVSGNQSLNKLASAA